MRDRREYHPGKEQDVAVEGAASLGITKCWTREGIAGLFQAGYCLPQLQAPENR